MLISRSTIPISDAYAGCRMLAMYASHKDGGSVRRAGFC